MEQKELIQSFQDKELQVYRYVEANKEKASYMRIRELASACEVSTATVLRFVKKLGLESYQEFKYWCKQETEETVVLGETKEIIDCITKLDSPYYMEQIQEAADIIEDSDMVIFAGIGNSGGIAHYGARVFSNAGTFALCQDDPFYHTVCVKGKPVVIVLSVSGETPELIQQLQGYHQQGCPLLCVTTSAKGAVSKMCDLTIAYHLQYRAIQPSCDFSSQIPAVYLIEAIAKELLHRKQEM